MSKTLLSTLNKNLTAKVLDVEECEFWLKVCTRIGLSNLDTEEAQAYSRLLGLVTNWYEATWEGPI